MEKSLTAQRLNERFDPAELRRHLLAIVECELDVQNAKEEDTFEQLGADSLDFILIIQEVRSEIGPISDEQAQKIVTVGDLLREALCAN